MKVRNFLRFEGLAIFLATSGLYYFLDGSLLLYLVLILAPDLSMVGYLKNNRIGASIYNTFHIYAVPLLVGSISYYNGWRLLLLISLIWISHIGLDRSLGYGLKQSEGFKYTHLGRIGSSERLH